MADRATTLERVAGKPARHAGATPGSTILPSTRGSWSSISPERRGRTPSPHRDGRSRLLWPHRIMAAFDRRCAGEPVHRIIGFRAFYGLDLLLSPATLEPRPDTETLVDAMLPCRSRSACGATVPAVFSILAPEPERSRWRCCRRSRRRWRRASIYPARPCRGRAERRELRDLGSASRRFILIGSKKFSGAWDAIVSNPPYISHNASIAGLAREVRDHEPLGALDGGPRWA